VIILFAVLAALLVAAIGLVAVGAATGRLAAEPPRSVFDLDEAVEHVSDRLPPDATATLTFDDVRQLLTWQVEYLEGKGVAGRSDHSLEARPSGPLVTEDDESVAYVLGRAGDAGVELDDVLVAEVLDAGLGYLVAIGAIGAPVPGPVDPVDP
jgi:hypothetical protein